jgi:glyceraldehyde-3-phosphate dehydrogenase (NADP+)
VRNSFAAEKVGEISRGTREDARAAVAAATESLTEDFPMHRRYEVLMRAADLIEQHQDHYAHDIAREGSKAIREARREPARSAMILRLAAEEGRRLHGETLPFDIRPGSENRVGYYMRVPVGVVAAILPFNDPLAVCTHKAGPAIAGGNAVVVKPDVRSSLSILRLAHHLDQAGLPAGRLSVITGHGEDAGDELVRDPGVRMVSFTGGARTGERIARNAGIRKLALELGSNSPVIVMADADVDRAVAATTDGAFAQAGQNCIGVQRVFIHEAVYDAFVDRLVDATTSLRPGPSLDETTDVCPLITEGEAERVEQWLAEATAAGARVLAGGRRQGALFWPSVLADVPAGSRVDCDEVYGPVVAVYRVASLTEAIDRANAADYGLHAAIFTESLRDAFEAVRSLEVGAVMVNDSTDYRLDVMPFGGSKRSGIGREGVRFALDEMTETRVVCLNLQAAERRGPTS